MTSRRELERALEAWGDEAVPEPGPLFLARLERDLLTDDGAVEVAIDHGVGGRVIPLRRRTGLTAVAVAAVAAVAGSAAALGVFRPEGSGVRVEPGSDGTAPPLPLGPSTSAAPTTSLATTVPATTAPVGTVATEPSTTSTTGATETTTSVVVTVGTDPATTTAVVTTPVVPAVSVVPGVSEPPTTRPTEPPATTAAPPATTAAPTTTRATEPPPTTTFSVTCAVGVVDTRTAIVCEWTEPPGGAASYRILRGDQQAAVGRVLTPSPANARRYVDHDVVAGHTYSFLVHALDANGTKTGQSNLVVVACCTV